LNADECVGGNSSVPAAAGLFGSAVQRGSVMIVKSVALAILGTILGPALGIGLFVLMQGL